MRPKPLVRRYISEDQRAVLVSGRIPDIDASRLLPTVDELDKRLDAVRAEHKTYSIAVTGLGYRGRAGVRVTSTGIVLDIAGTPSAFIPKAAVTGAGRATWTIDRAISKEGLVFVRWNLPAAGEPVEVDSYFRPTDPAAFVTALDTLVPSEKNA